MPAIDLIAWVWQPIASPLQITSGAVILVSAAIYAYLRSFPFYSADGTE